MSRRFFTVFCLAIIACIGQIESRALEKTPSSFHPKELTVGRKFARKDVVQSAAKIHHGLIESLEQLASAKVDTCTACKPLVEFVSDMIARGKTLEEIQSTARVICKTVLSDEFCDGVINNLAPEFIYVINNTDHTTSEFCAYLAGGINDCIDEGFYEAFNWEIQIPGSAPLYAPPPLPSDGSPKLRVLQISDIHPDDYYSEGSLVECREPICCRAKWGLPTEEGQTAGGKFGGNGPKCDIPWSFVEDTFRYLSENEEFDFILWTGDIPPHDVWNQTQEANVDMLVRMMNLFKQYFPDTPIYPNLGNHETEPCNSYPIPAIYGDYPIDYLYSQLNESWRGLYDDFNPDTVLTGGYYSANVSPYLKIISINSNYGNAQDWFLIIDGEDPTSELAWLIEQFQNAEDNDQKVLLIGHIPPGTHGIAFPWGKAFNDITNRYKNILAGQFYGHTHMDEFEVVYDETDPENLIPINVVYVAPSLTTYSYGNPSYRVYTIDGDYEGSSFAILDFETYYIDIVEANANGVANWGKLYSAKEEYGLASLQPSEWHNLATRMETDETLFQKYYKNYHRDAFGKEPCDAECKDKLICAAQASWTGAQFKCKAFQTTTPTTTITTTKDSTSTVTQTPTTEKSRANEISAFSMRFVLCYTFAVLLFWLQV